MYDIYSGTAGRKFTRQNIPTKCKNKRPVEN
jgi:hypothetical protein